MAWVLDDGLTLVRDLAERLRPRYFIGLTGSVLVKGRSFNDLDVIVYPGSSVDQDKGFVEKVLTASGLRRLHTVDVVQAKWRRHGSQDAKHVEVWEYQGKKVDVFFLA